MSLPSTSSYHTCNGAVFSLIDVGSVTSPGVSKFVFEISPQPEGSGRPHRMVELYGNWLSWSIKFEGWCTRANYALDYTGGSRSSLQGFARSQNIFLAYMLLLDLA